MLARSEYLKRSAVELRTKRRTLCAFRNAFLVAGGASARLDAQTLRRVVNAFTCLAILACWSLMNAAHESHPQSSAATMIERGLAMRAMIDAKRRLLYVNLWGVIDQEDGRRFEALITPHLRAGYVLYRVTISSPGGSMEGAVEIGRQIRMLRAQVRVPFRDAHRSPHCVFARAMNDTVRGGGDGLTDPDGRECMCASACAFIWASGFSREGDVVGVHMFRFVGEGVARWTRAEFRHHVEDGVREFDAYLVQMGMPGSIRARIWQTPADELYEFTTAEIAPVSKSPGLARALGEGCQDLGIPWRPFADPVSPRCYRTTLLAMMRSGRARYLARIYQ